MTEGNSRLRLGIIGVIVFALFSALFARLWFLQVADSTSFAAQTEKNRVRTIKDPPVRGSILDDKGNVVVQNTLVDEVTVKRGLTPAETSITATNLARVLLMSKKAVLAELDSPRFSPYEPVTVAKQVSFDSLVYIEEHPELFPGVQADAPHDPLLPSGTTSPRTSSATSPRSTRTSCKIHKGQGYGQSDQIGKQGVEQLFESELRGVPRTRRLEVDSRGRFVQVLSDTPAQAGHDVELTLDLGVQKIAEDSLNQGMQVAQQPPSTERRQPQGRRRRGGRAERATTDRSSRWRRARRIPSSKFTNGIPADEFKTLTDPSQHFPLHQPGDAGPLRARLHVQALHVDRRARGRRHHAATSRSTTAASSTFGGSANKISASTTRSTRPTASST